MSRKQDVSKGVVGVRQNVSIELLKRDPKNPRTWDSENVSLTRASIKTFGFVEAVVFNKRTGLVVAGHQRIAALVKEGKDRVPLVVDGDWTAGDARALSFVLNAKAPRGRFVSKRAKPLLDDLQKSAPEQFVLLGLGTIMEQAEAEEAGNGKKKVAFDAAKDGWETVKVRVPPGVRAVYEEKIQRHQKINEFKTEGEAFESVFADFEPRRQLGTGS